MKKNLLNTTERNNGCTIEMTIVTHNCDVALLKSKESGTAWGIQKNPQSYRLKRNGTNHNYSFKLRTKMSPNAGTANETQSKRVLIYKCILLKKQPQKPDEECVHAYSVIGYFFEKNV